MSDRKMDEFEDSQSLLSLNHMTYEAPSSVCATSQRNSSQINFQPRSYLNLSGSEQLSLVLNAGSGFTLGPTSMLNFKIRVDNASGAGGRPTLWAWGNNLALSNEYFFNSGGSILNLFQEVSCSARSGELLFRELYKNQTYTSRLYKINKERREILGMMGGASADKIDGSEKFPLFPVNQEISFSVPMGELSQFFNTSNPIPPQLLSGATLRFSLAKISQCITLYTNATTLATADQALTTVSITQATAYLDQMDLFDSVNSLILSASNSLTSNGLQYSYNTQFNAVYQVGGSGNIDVQLSAARISNIIVKFIPRTASDWSAPGSYTGPMASASIRNIAAVNDNDAGGLSGIKLQFRLGNMIMPLYQIETATQSYQMVSDALNNISFASCEDPDSLKVLNKLSPCSVSFADYTRSVIGSSAGYGTGCFLAGLSFERCSGLNISGSSTNNARVLTLEYSGLKDTGYNALVTVNYLQICNVSTSNVIVNR